MEESKKLARRRTLLYQVWPGKNRPVCWGLCLRGPDRSVLCITLLLILSHSGVFFWFVARPLSYVVAGVDAGLTLLVLLFLFLTAFTEPGIRPRGPKPTLDGPVAPHKHAPTVFVKGKELRLKYCTACHIYRPPRCKHCRECDNCVEDFDHHCPWVSNCIGRRNYRYFVTFVFLLTTLDFFVLINCIVWISFRTIETNFRHALRHNVAAAVFTCTCFVFGWMLGGLSIFHCYLIGAQKSTNEELMGFFGGVDPRQDVPCYVRFFRLCCLRKPKSMVPLRAEVDPRDLLPDAEVVPSVAGTHIGDPKRDHTGRRRRRHKGGHRKGDDRDGVTGRRGTDSKGDVQSSSKHQDVLDAYARGADADAKERHHPGGRVTSPKSAGSHDRRTLVVSPDGQGGSIQTPPSPIQKHLPDSFSESDVGSYDDDGLSGETFDSETLETDSYSMGSAGDPEYHNSRRHGSSPPNSELLPSDLDYHPDEPSMDVTVNTGDSSQRFTRGGAGVPADSAGMSRPSWTSRRRESSFGSVRHAAAASLSTCSTLSCVDDTGDARYLRRGSHLSELADMQFGNSYSASESAV